MKFSGEFKQYYPVLVQFVQRDFKTKYRRSVLGILWSVLNPLGTMIVMTIVFSSFFRFNIPNFPVYLMCGQLIFNFFNEASVASMNSIVNNGSLIQKVYIPKYLLPLSSVLSSLVNLLTSFIALVIVLLFTRTPISWTVLLIFIPILYTMVFAYGLGLILSVIATSFRDMQHLYGVITVAWSYLTPIFYPMDILPENIAVIVKFNPLTQFVEMMRRVVLYAQVPTMKQNLYCIVVCSCFLILGLFVFKKHEDNFILKL